MRLSLDSRWCHGAANIRTYHLEELLATKLRALHQRRSGRDLFDLWFAMHTRPVDTTAVAACFREYVLLHGDQVSGDEIMLRLQRLLADPIYIADTKALLRPGIEYSPQQAADSVYAKLLRLIA